MSKSHVDKQIYPYKYQYSDVKDEIGNGTKLTERGKL